MKKRDYGSFNGISARSRNVLRCLIGWSHFEDAEISKSEIVKMFKSGMENGTIPKNLANKVKNCGKKTEIEIKTFIGL